MKVQDYDTFTKNQNVSKKVRFCDVLTLTNGRVGGVFQLDGGVKNRGEDAINTCLGCDTY